MPTFEVSFDLSQPDPVVLGEHAEQVKMQALPPEMLQQAHREFPINPYVLTGPILLGTLFTPKLRVKKAIPVGIERDGETVTAGWDEISEFGTGKSSSTAIIDLARSIEHLYKTLDTDQEHLGRDLTRVWGILQEHLSVA